MTILKVETRRKVEERYETEQSEDQSCSSPRHENMSIAHNKYRSARIHEGVDILQDHRQYMLKLRPL